MKKKLKIIKDNKGQWNHPGEITQIDSNQITMKGVPYPVLGVSDTGYQQMMYPEQEYQFNGSKVTEYPMKKAKSGIYIKPENKGKFTATKKATGKSTEELTHSKNPLTRKRAIFAQNAKKWHHAQEGLNLAPMKPLSVNGVQGGPNLDYKIPNQASTQSFDPTSILTGGSGPLSGITKAIGFVKQIQEEGRQMDLANQFSQVTNVAAQAASTRPEKVKRKYIRPEDQIFDPNQLNKSYGAGTNYLQLKKGGKLKKGQEGIPALPSASSMSDPSMQIGAYLAQGVGGGGPGSSNAGGDIGGTILGNVGAATMIPGAKEVGEIVGQTVGSLIDTRPKQIKKYRDQATKNIGNIAFQQGAQNMQGQYQGFMRTGGQITQNQLFYTDKYAMGGDLQTHWGGKAETVSYNPYLPDGGESVLFKGQSHNDGGIGMSFGKNKVEVEGGEPAVKLDNGGQMNSNLTVFGDMKIPSYGVSELRDKDAKGKKFKNYINDLNKTESLQNKKMDKALDLVKDNDPKDTFESLSFNSGKAMLLGTDMRLKEIAAKKHIAAGVQNAILDAAEEHNLDSAALAKGEIKKAKKGTYLTYQTGGEITNLKKMYNEAQTQKSGQAVKAFQDEFHRLYPNEARAILAKHPITNYGKKKGITNEDITSNEDGLFGPITKEYGAFLNDNSNLVPYTLPQKESLDYNQEFNNLTKIAPTEPVDVLPTDPGVTYSGTVDRIKPYTDNKTDNTAAFSSLLPYLRPSNARPLDPNQLYGETYALANNQLDPVQSQLYHPLLKSVSDVSYQDQLNANQSDFNGLQKIVGNNPAALSSLYANKYKANSGILGEQFRANQAMKQEVYNDNRATLNDATLKNLGILDQQYTRQATAKSNTKAVAQAALSSIADKIQKNKLENQTLGIYENLYNYRYDQDGHAINLNAPVSFTRNGVGKDASDTSQAINENTSTTQEIKRKLDKNGMPLGTEVTNRKTEKNNKNGGLVKAFKYM